MDIGARLRQAREARGLTIDALSRSTRVQPRILSAIEQNDSVSIPPRPYGRGFVRAYASEVGLDPDGTVRDFFSQFVLAAEGPAIESRSLGEQPRNTPARGWLWPAGAVLAYVAIGALVIFVGRWATRGPAEAQAVGTTGTAVPAPASQVYRLPPIALPPPVTGVAISLEAARPVWVTARVDGRRTVYRTLQSGERVSLEGDREVTIRTGDAGALTWQVNRGTPALMGQSGEVRTATVTPGNAAQFK
jgi:transcriptional regulator with XRE-family HTH domain